MPVHREDMMIAQDLLAWYDAHARALPWRVPPGEPVRADPYRVWLSEIMLQQTTVAAVRPYFRRFVDRWPDVQALAAADDAEVMAAWAGLGYYARARNMLAAARAVVGRHGGAFPADVTLLRALPGVGDYTAAAIAAIAFGIPAAVVDGNVERVIARLFAISAPLPGARPAIRAALAPLVPADRPGDFAQAMMDLGAGICTPRAPRCGDCPLAAACRAYAAGSADQYPVKPAKKPRPDWHGTAWWVERDGAVLLVRRPESAMLGGMRALPGTDWRVADPAALPPAACRIVHGFTHARLMLDVEPLAAADAAALALDGEWWPATQLDAAGLPALYAKAVASWLDRRMLMDKD